MKKILLFLFISLSISSVVIAQNDSASVLDGMKDRFKSEEFNVIMLLQSTAAFSFQDDDFNGGREFGLGAPLLDFKGSLPNNFMYSVTASVKQNAIYSGCSGWLSVF